MIAAGCSNVIRLMTRVVLAGVVALVTVVPSYAFSLSVSPPRFELSAKPGKVVRDVFTIANVGLAKQQISVKTNDWGFNANGDVIFWDDLQPNSCRPWVSIQSAAVSLMPGASKRYRFEVKVPDNVPMQECRFAIMLEGDAGKSKGEVSMPLSGRIAVIVYVAIADAQPKLTVKNIKMLPNEQKIITPVLDVENAGVAHGRLDGYVTLTDAKGTKWDMRPASDAILPEQSRVVALQPSDATQPDLTGLTLPATVTGTLDDGVNRITLNQVISP